jgi:hypothetical protein
MKCKRFIGLFVVVFSLIMAACSKEPTQQDIESKGLPSSGGKTLEAIVVVPDELYKGEIKDSVGKYFMKACEWLPQPEPLFDVVQMNPTGFFNSEMFTKHRNIIIIDIKAGNPNKLKKQIDYKSYPQAYFEFSVDNRDSLFALMARYSDLIKRQFYTNEHKRVDAAFKKLENTDITRKLKSKYGFHLTLSEEFYLAVNEDNFVWIRKEPKDCSLGIMIYAMDCKNESQFKEENIIALRDTLAKKYIPGPTRGSYMGTEERFGFIRDTVQIGEDKITAIETRGLWRLYNDFMGGPFVNYCFRDDEGKRFVMIDCFVYSPKQSKRDQLMQLESVAYGIKYEKNPKKN